MGTSIGWIHGYLQKILPPRRHTNHDRYTFKGTVVASGYPSLLHNVPSARRACHRVADAALLLALLAVGGAAGQGRAEAAGEEAARRERGQAAMQRAQACFGDVWRKVVDRVTPPK